MGIDIRLPIGILFTMLGLILAAYGALAGTAHYQQTLGMNINLIWGIVLLVFGLIMFLFGRRAMRATPQKIGPHSKPSGH